MKNEWHNMLKSTENEQSIYALQFYLKIMNHDIRNAGYPTYLDLLKRKYWEKIIVDTINWEKFFDNSDGHK